MPIESVRIHHEEPLLIRYVAETRHFGHTLTISASTMEGKHQRRSLTGVIGRGDVEIIRPLQSLKLDITIMIARLRGRGLMHGSLLF